MSRAAIMALLAVWLFAGGGTDVAVAAADGAVVAQAAKKARPRPAARPQPPMPTAAPERVEADVSTRTIAITSGYSGAEILVFGAI
jgi:hypothetical protein